MTTNDLTNAAPAIEAKYYELGGKKEFFSEFLMTLGQSIEFDLNEAWVETPIDLVSQWFTGRFKGEKQKITLADSISSIAERNGNLDKTFSHLEKAYL